MATALLKRLSFLASFCQIAAPVLSLQRSLNSQIAAAHRIESSNGKFPARQRAPFITVKR
jgi:hypothetical protein